jgi:hypothetical protein
VIFGPLILALLHGGAGPAVAVSAPPTSPVIAVILPAAPNASMLEALYRLRGEADSVGLELRLVDAAADAEPQAQLDSVARGLAPAAVVALVGKAEGEGVAGAALGSRLDSIDVWCLDRTTGKTQVGHLTVDERAGDRTDLLLAVRVVDFIRARMFDSLVRSRAAARAKPRPVVAHEVAGRFSAAAGVGSLGSFSGFSPAFLPALEFGFAVRKWLRLALGAEGLGTRPSRDTGAGNASMDQKLVKVSAVFAARPFWRLYPFVEAGAAAYFVSVHGEGYNGNVGYDPSSWSPGFLGAAGIGVILSRHLVLQLGGGGMVLVREPKIFITDSEVARTGRPAWVANAMLGVAF